MGGFIPDQYKVSPRKTENKQANLSEKTLEKKKRLSQINPNTDVIDGDSLNAAILGVEQGNYLDPQGHVQDSTRVMSGIDGESFDTAETFHPGFYLDPRRGARQLRAIAANRGVDVNSLDITDIFSEGDRAAEQFKQFLKQGQEDPNNVNTDIGDTGQGHYGRAGVNPQNLNTGAGYLETYKNDPNTNLAYYSHFNDEGRNRVEAAKKALRAENEATNIISDADSKTFVGGLANSAIAVGSTAAGIALGVGQLATDAASSFGLQGISEKDIALYEASKNKAPKDRTPEEQALYEDPEGMWGPTANRIEAAKYPQAASKKLGQLTEYLHSKVNDRAQGELLTDLGSSAGTWWGSTLEAVDRYEKGDKLGAVGSILGNTAAFGGNIVKAGAKSPGGIVTTIGESIGMVQALAKKGLLGAALKSGAIKENFEGIQQEYEKLHGEPMGPEETIKAAAAATVSTALDFGSLKVLYAPLFKAFNKSKDFATLNKAVINATTDAEKKIAAENLSKAAKKLVEKSTAKTAKRTAVLESRDTKFKKTLGVARDIATGRAVKGLAQGVASELPTETVQDLLEQAGAKQGSDTPIDPVQAITAGALGGLAGGATAAGTHVVGPTIGKSVGLGIDGVKKVGEKTGVTDKINKVKETREKTKATFAERIDPEYKHFDPADAMAAAADEFAKDGADYASQGKVINDFQEKTLPTLKQDFANAQKEYMDWLQDPEEEAGTDEYAAKDKLLEDALNKARSEYDDARNLVADFKKNRKDEPIESRKAREKAQREPEGQSEGQQQDKGQNAQADQQESQQAEQDQQRTSQSDDQAYEDYLRDQDAKKNGNYNSYKDVPNDNGSKSEDAKASEFIDRVSDIDDDMFSSDASISNLDEVINNENLSDSTREYARATRTMHRAFKAYADRQNKTVAEVKDEILNTVTERATNARKAIKNKDFAIAQNEINKLQSHADTQAAKIKAWADAAKMPPGTKFSYKTAGGRTIEREVYDNVQQMNNIVGDMKAELDVMRAQAAQLQQAIGNVKATKKNAQKAIDRKLNTLRGIAKVKEKQTYINDKQRATITDITRELIGLGVPMRIIAGTARVKSSVLRKWTGIKQDIPKANKTETPGNENNVPPSEDEKNTSEFDEEEKPKEKPKKASSANTIEETQTGQKQIVGQQLAEKQEAYAQAIQEKIVAYDAIPENVNNLMSFLASGHRAVIRDIKGNKEYKKFEKYIPLLEKAADAQDKENALLKEQRQFSITNRIELADTAENLQAFFDNVLYLRNINGTKSNGQNTDSVLLDFMANMISNRNNEKWKSQQIKYKEDYLAKLKKEKGPSRKSRLIANLTTELSILKSGNLSELIDASWEVLQRERGIENFPIVQSFDGTAVKPNINKVLEQNPNLKIAPKTLKITGKNANPIVQVKTATRTQKEIDAEIARIEKEQKVRKDLLQNPEKIHEKVEEPKNSFKDLHNDIKGKYYTAIGDLVELRKEPALAESTEVPKEKSIETAPTGIEAEIKNINSVDELSDFILKHSKNTSYEALLDRITAFLDPELRVIQFENATPDERKNMMTGNNGKGIGGRTRTNRGTLRSHTLILNGNIDSMKVPGHAAETMMHELIHAATTSILMQIERNPEKFSKAQLDAYAALTVMHEQLTEEYNTLKKGGGTVSAEIEGGIKNLREFVAIGLSNSEFQDFMKNSSAGTVLGKKVSKWSKFTQKVMSLLGIEPAAEDTFSQLLEATNALFPTTEKVTTENVTPIKEGGAVVDDLQDEFGESDLEASLNDGLNLNELDQNIPPVVDADEFSGDIVLDDVSAFSLDGEIHDEQKTQQKSQSEVPEGEISDIEEQHSPEDMVGEVHEDDEAFVKNGAELNQQYQEEKTAEAKRNPGTKRPTRRQQAFELIRTLDILNPTGEYQDLKDAYILLKDVYQDSDRANELQNAIREARKAVAEHAKIPFTDFIELRNLSNHYTVTPAQLEVYEMYRTLAQASFTTIEAIRAREEIFEALRAIPLERLKQLTADNVIEDFADFYSTYGHANPTNAIITNGKMDFVEVRDEKTLADPNFVQSEDIVASEFIGSTPKSKGPLGKMTNFFRHFLTHIGKAETTARYNLSTLETEMLNGMATEFIPRFVKKLEESVRRSDTKATGAQYKYKFQNDEFDKTTANILRDEHGRFDPNVASAMAVSVLNYLVTNKGSLFHKNVKEMNAFMGRDKETPITAEVYALLALSGENLKTAQQDIGQSIREQLGLRGLDTTDGRIEPKLDLSLGQMALHTAHQMKLVQYNTLSQSELQKARTPYEKKKLVEKMNAKKRADIELPEGMNEEGIVPDAQIHFVSLAHDSYIKNDEGLLTIKPKSNLGVIIKNFGETPEQRKVFARIFGLSSFERTPEDEARPTVKMAIKGTIIQPSEHNAKGLKHAQDLEWFGKATTMDVFSLLTPDIALAIAGKKTDFSDVHFSEDETIKAQNDTLDKEYKDAVEYLIGRGYDIPHHYPQSQYRNGRNGPTTNKVNPQASKIHRFLVAPKSWTKTVRLKSKKHKKEVLKLKVAIMAGFGMEADAHSFNAIADEFTASIFDGQNVHEDYAAAVDVLRKVKADPKAKLSKADQQILVEAVSKAGEKYHSLDALITLRDYVDAVKSGADTMEASIPREIDGVTNGLIGMVMQFAHGGDSMRMILRAGGIQFKGEKDHIKGKYSYDKRKAQVGTRDNYEELGMQAIIQIQKTANKMKNGILNGDPKGVISKEFYQLRADQIETLRTALGELITDQNVVSKLARTIFKYPVMYASYGQAMAGILDTLLTDLTSKLYSDVMAAESPEKLSAIIYNSIIMMQQNAQRNNYNKRQREVNRWNNNPNNEGKPRRVNDYEIKLITPEKEKKYKAQADAIANKHYTERRHMSFPNDVFLGIDPQYANASESKREQMFVNNYKEAMKHELEPVVTVAMDKLLGDLPVALDNVNAAFRVSSEIFAGYWQHFLDTYAAKHNGAIPSKHLQQKEFERLAKAGVVPLVPHASSQRGDRLDGIQVTDTEKMEVDNTRTRIKPAGENATIPLFKLEIDFSSGRAQRKSMYLPERGPNGEKILNPEMFAQQESMGDNVSMRQYIGDIGAKGGVSMIHSLDGNVQSQLMAMYDILNIHDAQMSNFLEIDDQAKEANKTWYNFNTQWSVVDHVGNTLARSMEAMEKIERVMDPILFQEMESTINGFLRDREVANNLKEFTTEIYPGFQEKTAANRDDLFNGKNRIIAVAQFPSEDSGYQPSAEDATEFNNKEEYEKNINDAVETSIFLFTRGDFIVQSKTKNLRFKDEDFNDAFDPDNEIDLKVIKGPAGWVVRADGVPVTEPTKTQKEAINDFGVFVQSNGGIKATGQLIRGKKFHGSSSDDRTGFNEVYNRILTSDTITQLFDDLSKHPLNNVNITENTPESKEHVATLKKLIEDWVRPALLKVDDINLFVGTHEGESNTGEQTDNRIYVKATEGILKSQTDMSMQEVMAHELVHAIWSEMIDQNPRIRAELKKLFNIARKSKDISYKDFLEYDGDVIITARNTGNRQLDEAYEIKEAKKRYDYIFNNPKGYLHEFAAFGLTNESFMNALSRVKNVTDRNASDTDTVFDKLVKLFLKFTDFIFRSKFKGSGSTLDVALRNLANSVNNVKNQNKTKMDDWWDAFYGVNQKVKSAIMTGAAKPINWVLDTVVDKDAGKVKKGFAKIVGLPLMLGDRHFREATNRMMYGIGVTMNNPGYKLLQELSGASALTRPYHRMIRVLKHTIDSTVNDLASNNTKWAYQAFDPKYKITNQMWEQLNEVILKGDLVSIMEHFSIGDILGFLTDDQKINMEISKRDDQLRVDYGTKNGYYYANQAQNLGGIMITGKSGLEEGLQNAHVIANLGNLNHQISVGNKIEKVGNLEQAEIDVDILATLNAITRMNKHSRKTVAKIIEREYSRGEINGISTMTKMHHNFKKDSLKQNFGNNRTLMIKGYTHEHYDQMKSMKIGTKAQEAEMRDIGFIPVGTVSQDKNSTQSNPANIIYISNTGYKSSRVSGAWSYQSRISRGEDLVEQMLTMTDQAVGKKVKREFDHIRNSNLAGVKQQFKGKVKLNYDNNYLIPILSPNTGTAKNYRYTMSEQNKKEYLGKKDFAHKVIGRMIASAYNKEATEKGNIDFLKLAHEDFRNNFHKTPRAFVEISAESKNPAYREYYKMMAEHDQFHAKQIWGKKDNGDAQPIMVREDLLDLVFGYNKASLTDWIDRKFKSLGGLPYFMKYIMKHSGIIWTRIIGSAKRNIVLMIPEVLMNNMVSNSILLMMMGVSPKNMIKHQKDAYVALSTYQTDWAKMKRLEHLAVTFPDHKLAKERAIKAAQLAQDLARNPIKKFIDEGLFQQIVEDIDITDTNTVGDAITRAFDFEDQAELYQDKIPGGIKEFARQFTVAPDTKLAKFMTNATAYSDFAGRYALYKHLTERKNNPLKETNGVSQEAIDIAMDTFIDYDIPTSPLLQWANDMGIMMFTKYLFRIQRVIFRLFRDAPATLAANALVQTALEDVLGNPADILESNIIGENFVAEIPYLSGDRWGSYFNANFLRLFGWIPGIDNTEGLSL